MVIITYLLITCHNGAESGFVTGIAIDLWVDNWFDCTLTEVFHNVINERLFFFDCS